MSHQRVRTLRVARLLRPLRHGFLKFSFQQHSSNQMTMLTCLANFVPQVRNSMTQLALLHAVCMYHKAASCYCSLQTQNLMPGQCMKRMSMGSMHSLALVLGLCTHILTNFWTARIYLEGIHYDPLMMSQKEAPRKHHQLMSIWCKLPTIKSSF